jgi:hypothetical protein
VSTFYPPTIRMLAERFGSKTLDTLQRPWVRTVLTRCPDALTDIFTAVCAGSLHFDPNGATVEQVASLLASRADQIWNKYRGPIVYLLDTVTRVPKAWTNPDGMQAADAMVNLLLHEHNRRCLFPEVDHVPGGPYRAFEGLAEIAAGVLHSNSLEQRMAFLKSIPALCERLVSGDNSMILSEFAPLPKYSENDLHIPFASIAGTKTRAKLRLANMFQLEARSNLGIYDESPLSVAHAAVLLDLSSLQGSHATVRMVESTLLEASTHGAKALSDATENLWCTQFE